MKNLLCALALSLAVVSCAGTKARTHALLPAAVLAWENVQVDYEAGVADGLADGDLSLAEANSLLGLADQMTAALDSGDRSNLLSVPWETTMSPWAIRGVGAAVDAGELGPNGASILYARISNFTAAFAVLTERVTAKVPQDVLRDRSNPYIIEPQERRLLAAL